ncbi:MAG TPA: arginine N-succinyltransferase, partial [Chthoniobacterales bacterium]
IRDLMPKYPIYVAMLPAGAQAAIGQVHRDAAPALRILLAQGFQPSPEVDIFDAGPLLWAPRMKIKTVREARITGLAEVRPLRTAELSFVAHVSLDFRACLAGAEVLEDGKLAVTAETAARLQVNPGSRLIYLPRNA